MASAISARRHVSASASSRSSTHCWTGPASRHRTSWPGIRLGGFTIRLFASRYPSQVAGLVLIDASHEDFANRLHEADAQTQQQRRRQTQRQIELGLAALPGQADHGRQHRSYDPSGAARGSDCGAPRCHRAGTEELTLIGRVRGGKDSRRLDSKKIRIQGTAAAELAAGLGRGHHAFSHEAPGGLRR